MPVLSGSMSTMGYFAQGELPSDFKQTYIDAMRQRRFKDIDPASDRDQAEGWVTLEDPFDTEFDLNKVFFTDYVVMSLRIDRIRIPAAVFKLHLQKALVDYRTEKGKEKLSKGEKDEVRDFLESQLRRRVLPSVQTIDAAWNLESNRVWLFSHNKGINEIFQQLFHDTFGFTLTPKNPYVQLLHSDLDDDARDLALNIESAVFAVPSDR
jgi:recombination associated protein RdgC